MPDSGEPCARSRRLNVRCMAPLSDHFPNETTQEDDNAHRTIAAQSDTGADAVLDARAGNSHRRVSRVEGAETGEGIAHRLLRRRKPGPSVSVGAA